MEVQEEMAEAMVVTIPGMIQERIEDPEKTLEQLHTITQEEKTIEVLQEIHMLTLMLLEHLLLHLIMTIGIETLTVEDLLLLTMEGHLQVEEVTENDLDLTLLVDTLTTKEASARDS